MKILGISGSIRDGSYNTAALMAAKSLLPEHIHMDIHSLRELPLYDDVLAAEDPPHPVNNFRNAIAAADALLIASPEYNYSMTGVLKNALDWAATFTISNVLDQKTIAILGASRTVFGTARAQLHLRQVLHAANARVIRKPEVYIRRAQDAIGDDGILHDQRTLEKIQSLLKALITDMMKEQ